MLELVAILASLAQRFNLEIISEAASYEAAITLAPTSPIEVRVSSRK